MSAHERQVRAVVELRAVGIGDVAAAGRAGMAVVAAPWAAVQDSVHECSAARWLEVAVGHI